MKCVYMSSLHILDMDSNNRVQKEVEYSSTEWNLRGSEKAFKELAWSIMFTRCDQDHRCPHLVRWPSDVQISGPNAHGASENRLTCPLKD